MGSRHAAPYEVFHFGALARRHREVGGRWRNPLQVPLAALQSAEASRHLLEQRKAGWEHTSTRIPKVDDELKRHKKIKDNNTVDKNTKDKNDKRQKEKQTKDKRQKTTRHKTKDQSQKDTRPTRQKTKATKDQRQKTKGQRTKKHMTKRQKTTRQKTKTQKTRHARPT